MKSLQVLTLVILLWASGASLGWWSEHQAKLAALADCECFRRNADTWLDRYVEKDIAYTALWHQLHSKPVTPKVIDGEVGITITNKTDRTIRLHLPPDAIQDAQLEDAK